MYRNLIPKYELVIFDFDNTLIKTDIEFSGIKYEDVKPESKIVRINNKYADIGILFNNLDEIRSIFKDLKRKNVKIAIASFAEINTLTKICDTAFPDIFDYIVTSDNINKESDTSTLIVFRHTVDLSCPFMYSKNLMIRTIMKKLNITDSKKVFMFDDNYGNYICFDKIRVNGYHNPKTGVTPKMLIDQLYFNMILNK